MWLDVEWEDVYGRDKWDVRLHAWQMRVGRSSIEGFEELLLGRLYAASECSIRTKRRHIQITTSPAAER